MNEVTEIAKPLTDIWSYAKHLLKYNLLLEDCFLRRYIEAVYVNNENTYHHILLVTNQQNVYVVIIIDMTDKNIFGHYILDLNKKYGLVDNEVR